MLYRSIQVLGYYPFPLLRNIVVAELRLCRCDSCRGGGNDRCSMGYCIFICERAGIIPSLALQRSDDRLCLGASASAPAPRAPAQLLDARTSPGRFVKCSSDE